MKQCPNCKTVYTDDSLRFCLTDGASLISAAGGDAETVQMSSEKAAPLRINVPPDSAPTVFTAPPNVQNFPTAHNQPVKKGFGLIVAGLLGILLLAGGGLAAAYFLLARPSDNKNADVKAAVSPTTTAAPTVLPSVAPTADETAKLKEEMANLKKQLENQKNQKPNQLAAPPLPPSQNGRTARANSPNDGFLALRSEPNSETGYRIAKIPHGASLTVLGCPKASNIGKMPGRWCQVDYNGQSGWAFDAFIAF